jgi:hypothetical protein
MTKTMLAKVCLVAAIGSAPLALSETASAATAPAPGTGLIGGCNMLNDPTMFSVAMMHASTAGDNGMFIGVAAAGDPYCQVSLGG